MSAVDWVLLGPVKAEVESGVEASVPLDNPEWAVLAVPEVETYSDTT